jgi:transcriptional regulator with XRE-family HTH domain
MYIPDGKKLRQLRKEKKLTQGELAKKVGTGQNWMVQLEKEKLACYDGAKIAKICKFHGVTEKSLSTGRKYKRKAGLNYCVSCGVKIPPRFKFCKVCITIVKKNWRPLKPVLIRSENVPDYSNSTYKEVTYDKAIEKRKIQYKINPKVVDNDDVEILPCRAVEKTNTDLQIQDWIHEG